MIGAIIIGVAYGVQVQPKNDPNIDAAARMYGVLNTVLLPGAFLVVSAQCSFFSLPCAKFLSHFVWFIYILFIILLLGYTPNSPIHPILVSRGILQAKSQSLVWSPQGNSFASIYAGETGNGEWNSKK